MVLGCVSTYLDPDPLAWKETKTFLIDDSVVQVQ